MKKKTIVIVIAIALLVIAGCLLFFTGVISFPEKEKENTPQKASMYIEYMDAFMLIDADGVVIGSTAEKPRDIPQIVGISFMNIVVGEPLQPGQEQAFAYAKKIVHSLSRNVIPMDSIYISPDLEATLYINKVKILYGQDNKTEEKTKEMRDFYDDFKNMDGTLDMIELSYNNIGYSFKPNKTE